MDNAVLKLESEIADKRKRLSEIAKLKIELDKEERCVFDEIFGIHDEIVKIKRGN